MAFLRLNTREFDSLVENWRGQCLAFGEDFDAYAPESIKHAKSICSEDPVDPRYGIYGLYLDKECDALVHVNIAALPSSSGQTLRLVWVLLAPRYDFIDLPPEEFAKISASLILSAVDLAERDNNIHHLKLHLGNFFDKQYFAGVALGLSTIDKFTDSRLRGNWFHLSFRRGV